MKVSRSIRSKSTVRDFGPESIFDFKETEKQYIPQVEVIGVYKNIKIKKPHKDKSNKFFKQLSETISSQHGEELKFDTLAAELEFMAFGAKLLSEDQARDTREKLTQAIKRVTGMTPIAINRVINDARIESL